MCKPDDSKNHACKKKDLWGSLSTGVDKLPQRSIQKKYEVEKNE